MARLAAPRARETDRSLCRERSRLILRRRSPRIPAVRAPPAVVGMDAEEEERFGALMRAATCRLCADVLDEDLSCLPCGHVFCADCVAEATIDEYICPECRVPFFRSDITPNYAMRDFVALAVELDALRERNVFLPIVSQIFLNGPYMAGLVITSLLLADVFNLGAAAISLMILPRPITFSLGASFAGWLVERLGGRPLVVFGTTGIAIGLLMIGFGAAQDELWMVGVGVGIQGAGSGVARPPIIAALTEAIGDRDVGVGTGMLNMTGQLGAAAGISILSALVDDGSSADRFLAVLAIAAAIEIIAVAMVGAIRFRGPVTTRTTPASPTAPYSAVVDLDRGRE